MCVACRCCIEAAVSEQPNNSSCADTATISSCGSASGTRRDTHPSLSMHTCCRCAKWTSVHCTMPTSALRGISLGLACQNGGLDALLTTAYQQPYLWILGRRVVPPTATLQANPAPTPPAAATASGCTPCTRLAPMAQLQALHSLTEAT